MCFFVKSGLTASISVNRDIQSNLFCRSIKLASKFPSLDNRSRKKLFVLSELVYLYDEWNSISRNLFLQKNCGFNSAKFDEEEGRCEALY